MEDIEHTKSTYHIVRIGGGSCSQTHDEHMSMASYGMCIKVIPYKIDNCSDLLVYCKIRPLINYYDTKNICSYGDVFILLQD